MGAARVENGDVVTALGEQKRQVRVGRSDAAVADRPDDIFGRDADLQAARLAPRDRVDLIDCGEGGLVGVGGARRAGAHGVAPLRDEVVSHVSCHPLRPRSR